MRSWAIYQKIYVVLDGCHIWIYCFSAYNNRMNHLKGAKNMSMKPTLLGQQMASISP